MGSWVVGPGGAFVVLAGISAVAAVAFAFAVDAAVANDVDAFAARLANERDRDVR